MEVINVFLDEIFDTTLPPEIVKSFVDEKTNSLRMGAILKSPILVTNLCFRFLWKNATGVFPSKEHARMFMTRCVPNGDVDIHLFVAFVREVVPLYAFVNLDVEGMTKGKQAFLQDIAQTPVVKQNLLLKFCYRYGVEPDDMHRQNSTQNPKDSLFVTFRNCVFSPEGYARVRRLNTNLATILEKEPLDLPEVPESLSSYYKTAKDMIDHYELSSVNVFNRYWNPFAPEAPANTTVFDAISFLTTADANFYKLLLGSTAIYHDSGDAGIHGRLANLVDAANAKDAQRSIVVFRNVGHADDESVRTPDYHVSQFQVADRFLMNFVPKLPSSYVLVGAHTYPQSPFVCSNINNTLYYCLHDRRTDGDPPMLPSHYGACSRYVTTDAETKAALTPLVPDKHVYVVIDPEPAPEKPSEHDRPSVLFNKEFQEHQWTAHLTEQCPFVSLQRNAYHPKMNILLYDQFLLNYYIKNRNAIDAFAPQKNKENVVVMVDNRPNIFSVISLYITMANLDTDLWSVAVVCNKGNQDFFKRFLGDHVDYITKFPLPTKKFSIDIYNDLLKEPTFWGTFTQYKKALFVQDDGMIVLPGMETDFLGQYAYVGAPWKREWTTANPNKFIAETVNPELVGNGGVSLRDIKQMKHICETYRHLSKSLFYDRMQGQPEDVFFSGCCVKEGYPMPDYEMAQKFATEQVCSRKSYGFHKFWVYNDLPTVQAFFDAYVAKEPEPEPVIPLPEVQIESEAEQEPEPEPTEITGPEPTT